MPLISRDFSLKPYNTFGIDASAKLFARFTSPEELKALLAEKEVKQNEKLVLGGGSNILFTKNFDGVVLKNEIRGVELIADDGNHYRVRVNAGANWHRFVLHCIEQHWAGVENLSLIPGCVGAGPIQNIGAYGVELKDVFHELEAVHIETGTPKIFNLTECSFGYRDSIFKQKEKNNWIITSVTLRLNKRPVFQTSYGAIDAELEKMNVDQLSIRAISQAVINIRSAKLPDPKKVGNAGSFFKNPVVARNTYEEIKKHHPDVPAYPIDEHTLKIPAGWLIEKAGWKGKSFGEYGVHPNQALVLVNYGNANGEQILQLSSDIMADIEQKFGVRLEREVNIV